MNQGDYGSRVLSRVMDPGFLLIAAGAVAVYAPGLLARCVRDETRRARAGLVIKAVGCAVMVAGAVLLFT